MAKFVKLQKWVDCYPAGTAAGNEEAKFFDVLARSEWQWRSTSAIVRETGLTLERVEEIIQKYAKKGMVIPHPRTTGQWGYWEVLDKEYWPTTNDSISDEDKKKRINNAKYSSGLQTAIPHNIKIVGGTPSKITVNLKSGYGCKTEINDYGQSNINKSAKLLKQLELMKDAMIVYSLKRGM